MISHDVAAGKRPLATPTPWVIGNLLVVAMLVKDIMLYDDGLVANGAYWGRDFVNVWTAGKLLLSGHVDSLYDLTRYHAAQVDLFGQIGTHNYSYPPATLLLTIPFALLPYPVALLVWLAGTGALFVHAVRPWWQEATSLPVGLLLLLPAATMNIWTGHYGFLFAALLILGWRALEEGRPGRAGLLFGLLLVKPHLALLVPLVLLLRREWTAIAVAAATVAALITLSLLLYGIDPWRDYLGITLGMQAGMIDATGGFFRLMSTSAATAMVEMVGHSPIVAAVQFGSAAFGLMLLVRATLSDAPLRQVALLAATATFMVLPYGFNYDLVVPTFAAALLLLNPRTTDVPERLALLGFLAPQLGMVMTALGAPITPLLIAGLAWAQYRAATNQRLSGRAGPTAAAAMH